MSSNVEIERKFLVDSDWCSKLHGGIITSTTTITQGYLLNTKEKVVRIRLSRVSNQSQAFITIKGARVGISCPEFEYPIPVSDAIEMLAMCDVKLEKIRRVVLDEHNQRWEIDEFLGLNAGLLMAELELEHEDDEVYLTEWLGKEVSDDYRYTNAHLIYNKAPNLE